MQFKCLNDISVLFIFALSCHSMCLFNNFPSATSNRLGANLFQLNQVTIMHGS